MTTMGQKKGTKRSLINAMRKGLSGLRTLIAGDVSKRGSSATSQDGQAVSPVFGTSLRLKQPIWVGQPRTTYSDAAVSTQDVPTAKQQRRARDRQMRAGLPTMSGRQWSRLRKAMYRQARTLTRTQQETVR